MKKTFVTLLALILFGSLVGCTEPQNTTPEETPNPIDNDFETVGEIVVFENNGTHIITGDMVDIFQVDEENSNNFYLGETVGVKRISEDKFELEKYHIKDFSVRHTTMGQLISTVSGEMKEVSKDTLILSTNDEDIEFKIYDEILYETGTLVTVDFINLDPTSTEKTIINIYNEDSKINLVVKEIKRNEDGMMLLDTEDENGLKYEIYVLGDTVLNFNHSDLNINDMITVYPRVIKESYPAQVDAKMITKQ